MLEFEFSSHGAGMIHAYRWEPEGQPRGVVQIIHGIAEYVPRYAGFAAFLNAHGLLVTGEDHMGHGQVSRHGALPFFRRLVRRRGRQHGAAAPHAAGTIPACRISCWAIPWARF